MKSIYSRRFNWPYLLAGCMLLLWACKGNRQVNQTEQVHPHPEFDLYSGGFKVLNIQKNDSALLRFKKTYDAREQQIILALNRIDFNNLQKVDSLLIPDSIWDDFISYTPFPKKVQILDSVDKCIFFSYPLQAFAVYEKGWLMRWGPSSMGSKRHPTPTGLSFANWKKKTHISTVDDEWLLRWNVNIYNHKGIGWHQYNMPGYPASHSCLRLLEADARWLYTWVDNWILQDDDTIRAQGTPVLVSGHYNFDTPAPWWKLRNSPTGNRLSEADLASEIKPHLTEILKQQAIRKKVIPDTAQ